MFCAYEVGLCRMFDLWAGLKATSKALDDANIPFSSVKSLMLLTTTNAKVPVLGPHKHAE